MRWSAYTIGSSRRSTSGSGVMSSRIGREHAADVVLSHEAHRLLEGGLWFEAQRRARAQEPDRLANGVLVENAPGARALRFLESGQLLVGDLGVHWHLRGQRIE